jgi:tetratricopeptide (TPR) repeat protein
MQTALATLRKEDPDRGLHMYESYPFVEYSLGILFERIDQRDSARAAYERALVDDVRFFPAHRGLGLLRQASGDTAGAIGEYSQAVELAPSDALPSYELGLLWIAAGHPDSAVARLERASKAEPFYPAPHYPLGLLYERSGFLEEAAEHYTIYLRLAPQLLKGQAAIVRRRLDAHQVTSKAP